MSPPHSEGQGPDAGGLPLRLHKLTRKEFSMRAWSTVTVVLFGAAFLGGCSQTTSPTSPPSVQSFGASVTSSPTAVSTAAQHDVPFKGTMEGTDTDSDPTPTSIVVTTDGTGTATDLGRFSFTQRVTVDFTTSTSMGTSYPPNENELVACFAGLQASGYPNGDPNTCDWTKTTPEPASQRRRSGAGNARRRPRAKPMRRPSRVRPRWASWHRRRRRRNTTRRGRSCAGNRERCG